MIFKNTLQTKYIFIKTARHLNYRNIDWQGLINQKQAKQTRVALILYQTVILKVMIIGRLNKQKLQALLGIEYYISVVFI